MGRWLVILISTLFPAGIFCALVVIHFLMIVLGCRCDLVWHRGRKGNGDGKANMVRTNGATKTASNSLLKNPGFGFSLMIHFGYESGGGAMRGRFWDQGGLFSYLSPEARVPPRHPLRQIRELVRTVLKELSVNFGKLYSSEGRPSIPPEQLLCLAAASLLRDPLGTAADGAARLQPSVSLVRRACPRRSRMERDDLHQEP
jgi:hypothetical protein